MSKIDPSLAHMLPGVGQKNPEQEKYDPAKATHPKGRFGKITIPLSGKVYYAPTYVMGGAGGIPVLPFAFSTAVHGIENAKIGDLTCHRDLNFVNVGFIAEEIEIPDAIKNYITVNKENLKKSREMVAWDRLI